MEHMKKMLKMAIEEAEGAKNYIKCALHDKSTKKHAADKFCTLAEEELKHADELKALAARDLEEYQQKHSTVPEHDRAIYEIRIEDIADLINDVKRDIMLYRS